MVILFVGNINARKTCFHLNDRIQYIGAQVSLNTPLSTLERNLLSILLVGVIESWHWGLLQTSLKVLEVFLQKEVTKCFSHSRVGCFCGMFQWQPEQQERKYAKDQLLDSQVH